MTKVSKEEIAVAKQIDLLTYLQSCEPHSIRKCGTNTYELKQHDSLKISNGLWNWFSRGIGGKTAIDFLIHVRGMDFVSAVQSVLSNSPVAVNISHEAITIKENSPKVPLVLPERYWDNFRVIAYLQGRGIDREIINYCIEKRILYESKQYHNCVFIGRDKNYKAKFACLRGLTGRFFQDVKGSDKHYSFSIPTKKQVLKIFSSTKVPYVKHNIRDFMESSLIC